MTHPTEQKLAALRPNLIDDPEARSIFEYVPLTLFASKFNTAGTPGVRITLVDLWERWDQDAHYTQYTGEHRLLKEEPEGAGEFSIMTVDVDPVGVATDDDFWRLVVRGYGMPDQPNVIYQTKRGAHLLWWLDPPLVDAQDFEQRRSVLVARLMPSLAKTAYRADPACKDWTRLFRCPRVVRSDRLDDGTWNSTDLRDRPIWVLRTEGLNTTEWEVPPAPPRRTFQSRPRTVGDRWAVQVASRWLDHQPGAVSGAGGHRQTFKVAIRLVGGFGLDEEAAFGVMSEWNETKCDPPWSERELRHKIHDAHKAVQQEKTDE